MDRRGLVERRGFLTKKIFLNQLTYRILYFPPSYQL